MTVFKGKLFNRYHLLLFLFALPLCTYAQKDGSKEKVVVVDDEACGCELVFIDGIQTTELNGRFGFKREDGSVIVEPTYMFVDKFHDGYCKVFLDYNRCGLIDRNGRVIVPAEYDDVQYPTDGMILVKNNELHGYYDTSGKKVIDFQYRAASGFNEGVAVVAIDFDSNYIGYGYIDKSNRLVIAADFEYAFPFEEGYAIVKQYDRYGMIDHNGKKVLTTKYMELTPMHEGCFLAVDERSGNIAVFNSKFKQLSGFVYEKAIYYNEGIFVMERNGKKVLVDRNGKEKYGVFDNTGGFFDGYAWVENNGKYGIIDKRGRTILPIEYDNSGYRSMEYRYSEGLFMVEKDGLYGFVDTKGKIVIPIEYQSAQHCTEGLIPLKKDGAWGLLDRNGNTVLPFKFDAISFFEWGRAEVVYNGETFKINTDGKCVKNCSRFPYKLR